MSTKNTGVTAFPSKDLPYSPDDHKGMTLRDDFASKAMQGLIAADVEFTMSPRVVAKLAYSQADAMLEARGE